MSTLSECCRPCPEVQVTQVPGAQGDAGADGADGSNGTNAFTTLAGGTDPLPAPDGTILVTVGNSTWMGVGQEIFIEGPAHFVVDSIPGPSSVVLQYKDYSGDVGPGSTLADGAVVSPSGPPTNPVGALPTALTDSSTGTASNIIAAGSGVQTLSFFVTATSLANGDILTNYTPGYRFKILSFDARCATPVTTGAKAATLNIEIDSTNLTGGVISLAGTYAQGAAQNGSAVTANNVGTALQSISIEASSVTAFVEGAFWLIIAIQNMDTADAIASLADHINDLITALT